MLVYILYGHLEYFTVIWYILWPFSNVVVIWYIFPRFGILCEEKSGNPAYNDKIFSTCQKLSFANNGKFNGDKALLQ
jgi:hypothetical protein